MGCLALNFCLNIDTSQITVSDILVVGGYCCVLYVAGAAVVEGERFQAAKQAVQRSSPDVKAAIIAAQGVTLRCTGTMCTVVGDAAMKAANGAAKLASKLEAAQARATRVLDLEAAPAAAVMTSHPRPRSEEDAARLSEVEQLGNPFEKKHLD